MLSRIGDAVKSSAEKLRTSVNTEINEMLVVLKHFGFSCRQVYKQRKLLGHTLNFKASKYFKRDDMILEVRISHTGGLDFFDRADGDIVVSIEIIYNSDVVHTDLWCCESSVDFSSRLMRFDHRIKCDSKWVQVTRNGEPNAKE